jgi:hypothetical protein
MRPLCGAIIVAGSMIGLGLTALAIGTRYHTTLENVGSDGQVVPLHLHQMDRPLLYILVFLTVTAVIGLGIAFLGLSYHHLKRTHEMLHRQQHLALLKRPKGQTSADA